MSFASWQAGEYSQAGSDLSLAMITSTGAGWISLVVTRYQDTIASTTIYSSAATPTDADLIHAINRAHALGLKVMLKPHLDLAADPSHWRGEIGQGFTGAQWATWFTSYQAFINHYAQLAQAQGVDQFCVGTELVTTETQSNAWRTTIVGVRSRFSGPLTYASNHGSESHVTWWDALDFIGVDAYYALTDKNDPTLDELRAGWAPHVATLASLAATWGKPVLLTEIGYRSVDGANRQPWDWQTAMPLDLQEQVDTYQAAFESLFDQPWLAGIYWWMWDPDPYERGGSCDTDYTPYDKPAEDVLRRWYGAPLRYDRLRPQADYSRTQTIYQDSLAAGWANASWSAVVNYSATNPVHSPPYAISVTAQPWGAARGLACAIHLEPLLLARVLRAARPRMNSRSESSCPTIATPSCGMFASTIGATPMGKRSSRESGLAFAFRWMISWERDGKSSGSPSRTTTTSAHPTTSMT